VDDRLQQLTTRAEIWTGAAVMTAVNPLRRIVGTLDGAIPDYPDFPGTPIEQAVSRPKLPPLGNL